MRKQFPVSSLSWCFSSFRYFIHEENEENLFRFPKRIRAPYGFNPIFGIYTSWKSDFQYIFDGIFCVLLNSDIWKNMKHTIFVWAQSVASVNRTIFVKMELKSDIILCIV